MNDRIYKKFILAFLLSAIISTILILFLGSNFIYKYLSDLKAIELKKISTGIVNKLVLNELDDTVNINNTIINLKTIANYNEVEIWIISPKAKIVYNSNDSIYTSKKTILKNIYPYKIGSYYGIGTFDKIFNEIKLSIVRPIIKDYKTLGYVAIHFDYNNITEQGNGILKIFLIINMAVLLITLIVFGIFSFSVIRPINKIIRAVKEYSVGNLGYVVDVKSNDELGLLATALNDMSIKIAKSEEYQRHLIANVSHDFRSPLTSIKGYIEAILDGTIPEELWKKYLMIVLKESKRLSNLTEELLELNRADSGKMHLNIKEVEINKLIRDTISTFEQRCRKRNITIELIFESEDTIVLCDAGRIKQVFYNLIDNAIKFSYDNSEIIIETTINKGKLLVSIKDNGCGIVSDDLKKIWDRFYKSDLSRGRDKESSGLGLSIVKEIIQQHNENINVVSTLNAGTTFIFTLTLSKKEFFDDE